MKKIVIFFGGPSSEHDVSLMSAKAILNAINKEKYDIYWLYIDKSLTCAFFQTETLDTLPQTTLSLEEALDDKVRNCDLAFLSAIHGEFGEDGSLQSLLESYNIPYTGSGEKASKLAMDKYTSSLLVEKNKLALIPHTFRVTEELDTPRTYPLICKPNTLGSSVGVKIVTSESELKEHVQSIQDNFHTSDILLQEYLSNGLEVSCGYLETKEGKEVLLPPIEIIPQTSTFFDYDAKYLEGGSLEICPPKHLSKEQSEQISAIAQEIHYLLGCKLYSRSDFMVVGEKIYYLETNTLPGMTSLSLLPKEAKAVGISYPELIDFLIENS